MSRKFINKDDDIEDADVLVRPKKEVHFGNAPANNTHGVNGFDSDAKEASNDISSLTEQIVEQKTRIQEISKKQRDFEEGLKMLQGGNSNRQVQKTTEFENLGNEFQSSRIIKGISAIVEEEMRNRISNIEKQLTYEKKHSETFSSNLEENLKKFFFVEKDLKIANTKLEEEIRDTTEKLIRAERLSAMGELASRLAHDLKNPLTAIKGTIQILKHTSSQTLDDLTKRRIDLIEKSIFRMTHQIDGVLDFVKQTPLKKRSCSLNEVIVSAIQTIMIPPNITVSFPETDPIIVCDPDKMQVVFANIILNAVQAVENKVGEIVIDAAIKGTMLKITIKDTGPGIDPYALDKIFEPLYTTKQEGTGLGLASAQNIVTQHNGKITAIANPAEFSILLPLC